MAGIDHGDIPGTAGAAMAHARRTGEQRRQAAEQWRALLDEVRTTAGFESFGSPLTPEQMRLAAAGGTVVAINVTEFGCTALTLTSGGVAYVELPDLSEAEAADQATRFTVAITGGGSHPAGTIVEVLVWLWDVVAAPVLRHLGYDATPEAGREWPQIWWIPTGPLSRLPVHAAGHHGDLPGPGRRTVLDRVVSSYATTVRALYQARQSRTRRSNAIVVGLNHTPGQPDLTYAEEEARTVHRLLRATGPALLDATATRDAVRKALPNVGWAHFACHAIADPRDPADSFLALHDAPLRVRDLSSQDLAGGHLVFLSACSTAVTVRLLDESVHIASAFQLAGFTHAIATLWPVQDEAARTIAGQIYHMLVNGMPPARAVHDAVRATRDQPGNTHRPFRWAAHVHFGP